MARPPGDLRAFLLGAWRISRRIDDALLGLVGRLEGHALFAPAPDGLSYEETGRLRFGAHEGEATRRYLFAIETPSRAIVRHADGSLFHRLDLGTGWADVVHRCGADLYRGRYRVLGEDRLSVVWHVTGPRKRYRLATLHSRMGDT